MNRRQRPTILAATFTILLLMTSISIRAQTTVSGLVFSSDSDIPTSAHVHLYPITEGIGAEPIESIDVVDGSFELTIEDFGWYNLVATAANHDYVTIPLILTPSTGDLDLDITLASLPYQQEPDELSVIGSWNDFDFQSAEPMVKQEDGAWLFEKVIDEEQVQVQVIGLAETGNGGMRSVNLFGSDDYVYDGGGDYRSVIAVEGDTLRISVNPDEYFAAYRHDVNIRFSDNQHRYYWEVAHLHEMTEKEYTEISRHFAERDEEEMKQIAEEMPDSIRWMIEHEPLLVWKTFVDDMMRLIDEVQGESPKQFASMYVLRSIARFSGEDLDSLISDSDLEMIRSNLNPAAEVWRYYPDLAPIAAMIGVEDEEKALTGLVERTPFHEVEQAALSHLVMQMHRDSRTDDAARYYEDLKDLASDEGATGIANYVLKQYDPDKRVQPGNEVPDFEVEILASADLTDIGETVSAQSMRGTWYLIDFWATWCGPCIGEMPELHAAYKEFSGRNFTILSLSFDKDFSKVEAFLENRYDMPWLHAFVEGNFKSDLAKTFEVEGIPKPVLVSPQGEIVAVGSALRGEQLSKTLGRYLIGG